MSSAAKPEFVTNRAGERVADGINAWLAHLRTTLQQAPEMAIATAYFNPGGYGLLADELDHPGRVRLLLGADPQVPERPLRALSGPGPGRVQRDRLRRALEGQARTLEEDRDALGFSIDADATARRLVAWLRDGRVEVRRLEDRFLHGKAFVVTTHDDGVIAGSSNFTYAGLATNVELNLGQYQPHVVGQVRSWFDELWDEARPFDLAGLYAPRFEPHAPQLVYLRMLLERYGEEVAREAADEGAPRIHLTAFQSDGLWRARRILEERRGVLIADEVGLGKTYLAGELIREAVEERRQRVLVVAPATLRDGPWRKFLAHHQLAVDCVSFDDLSSDRRLHPEGEGAIKLAHDPDDYAMVVVDEAHNLRNPAALRSVALRTLLAGRSPKQVVLLTATPVNNSLWDLYYLLGYFLANDAVFADVGIGSLRDHFAEAMAMNPEDLSPEHLFDVLDAVAVRRTRPFVKRFYPNDAIVGPDGRPATITFPRPRVRKVDYDLDGVLPGFFDRFAAALDAPAAGDGPLDPAALSLARYAPSRFRRDGERETHELQLAGLVRSGLLKRFESSAHAFGRTCRTMAASHDLFLSVIDDGHVATGRALSDWPATDTDVDGVDEYVELHRDQVEPAVDYEVDRLRAEVARDRALLRRWADEAERVTRGDDPKLEALVEQLATVAAEARADGVGETDQRDRRKVLVFSYFADTVDWIAAHLEHAVSRDERLADYRDRIVAISGSAGSKEDALWGFAPRTTDAPAGEDEDRYDIVVTTDVLSEGVNLQQARHIVNYDLPWNPMRLVQRHGRVDRIGSSHDEVVLRCVFPDRRLDDLLGLEERLQRKIQQAVASVGAGEILPGSKVGEVVLGETRDELARLRAEDAGLFERGGPGRSAHSGEEYRQELRQALANDALAEQVRALPWGSGSGMAVTRAGAVRGYVFCVRVGDHVRPLLRYVAPGDGEPEVVADTLACLDHARPADGFDTPRRLDDETHAGAFAAWDVAKASVLEDWNHAADPANLTPTIPKALHRAAELVRGHRPPEMRQDDADRLVEILEAPYTERVVRSIRAVMSSADDPVEQVRGIARTVAELGLTPSPPPVPLPPIAADDVHLVCWMAIVPGDAVPGAEASVAGSSG